MLTHKNYLPILKAKDGEIKALQELSPASKAWVTPLLEIMDIPWDYEVGAPAKTIEVHLSPLSKKLLDCWGVEHRIFIDSNILDGDTLMSDGVTHHLEYIFSSLRRERIVALPVSGLNRTANYQNAVRNINAADKRGIVLRLEADDLGANNLQGLIDDLIAYWGIQPEDIDLVIDLKDINDGIDLLALTIQTFINTGLPYTARWRSLIVSSTSFPFDLTAFRTGTMTLIPRNEWRFYMNLIGRRLTRKPTFGDYTISHTELNEMDPRLLTISASIRYTCDTEWLIVRGGSTKKHGFGQYHDLCASLIVRPEYSGPAFSWGDNYINECAARRVGTGNPTTWRKVGNNHHIEKAISQTSILP